MDLRQADCLTNLAGESIADSFELKAKAKAKLRRAAEIAPWISMGDGI